MPLARGMAHPYPPHWKRCSYVGRLDQQPLVFCVNVHVSGQFTESNWGDTGKVTGPPAAISA